MIAVSCPAAPGAGRRLRRWAPVLALCGSALCLACPARAALSLPLALRLAEDRSRLPAAQDAAAASAREMAVAAAQRPDPIFKLGLSSLPVNGPDALSLTRDSFTMLSVGVMQELTRSDKLQARAARFEREAEAALAARGLALANLRRDTAMAWLDRHFLERWRELLQQQHAETALQIDAAEAAYRGGRGLLTEVFAARLALAQADDRLRQLDPLIASATLRLARWVGPPAEQALAAPPPLDLVRLASGPLQAQLDHHPQIGLLDRQQAVALAEAGIASTARRADWSLELSYSQRGPAYSNMLSINLAIPLRWDPGQRQDRELAARLATVEQLRAQREEAQREHLAEALGWLQQWQSRHSRLAFHDSTLIPLATQRTQAAGIAYRSGGAALSAVLEARRLEIDARIERLRLAMEAAGLWAQLEYLTATDPTSPQAATADHPPSTQENLR